MLSQTDTHPTERALLHRHHILYPFRPSSSPTHVSTLEQPYRTTLRLLRTQLWRRTFLGDGSLMGSRYHFRSH